jgi:hypothetical protein
MTPTLFDFNYHVLPGDVLLLQSSGAKAWGNRAGQRAMRPLSPVRTARFTHVALVISATHIADAIPGEGVRIRKWEDAAGHYDLSKCVVARHPMLSPTAYDPAALLARVQFYYAQRYTLTSLARWRLRHDKGIVCSQFVALILRDLGLPTLLRNPMSALPSDIDHRTRAKDGWRQFPFSTYGWHPGVSRPAAGTAYWTALEDSLSEAIQHLRPPEDTGDSQPLSAPVNVWDNLATTRDAEPPRDISEVSTRFSSAIGDRLASSMNTAEGVLRSTAELDRMILAMAEGFAEAENPDEDALGRLQAHWPTAAPNRRLSAAELVERWHALYVDAAGATPQVLADDDAPQRLVRHRRLLESQIEQLTQLAKTANEQAGVLVRQFSQLADLHRKGGQIPAEVLPMISEAAASVVDSMDWLADESVADIQTRCDRYEALVLEDLMPRAPELGADVAQQAMDQIKALLALDHQHMEWVGGHKPVLLTLLKGT